MGSLSSRVLLPLLAASSVALLACGERPPPAGGPPRHVRVHGSPFEMGEQHGRALRAEIAEAVGPRLRATFRSSAPDAGTPDFLEKSCRAYAKEMKGYLPESVREELRGLAAGSGQSEDDLFLVDVVREGLRWHGTEPRVLEGAFASPPREVPRHVFAVAAYGGFLEAGVEGRLVVLERSPAEGAGAPTMVLTFPGSLGALAGTSNVLWAVQAEVGLDVRRGSLKGPPFGIGLRVALERTATLEDLWQRLPKLSGNRVLAGVRGEPSHAGRRMGLVAYAGDDPADRKEEEWVLAAAGPGGAESATTRRQDEALGAYPARPTAAEAPRLAAAGRSGAATGPVVGITIGRIDWWGSAASPGAAPTTFRFEAEERLPALPLWR